MIDEMKCPVCGNTDYGCVDDEADFTAENPIYTWICFCDKCNHGFNIVAKLKWDSFKYEDISELK